MPAYAATGSAVFAGAVSVAEHRVLLIAPAETTLAVLASRLRMQGYSVTECTTAAEGARHALSDPPRAVVADLWMPGISGVQLCRLLKAEPATTAVPVILRGPDGQRNRFWAERAGAAAYVVKGRMGDLVRALSRAIADAPEPDTFFTHLAGDESDVRDRIAAHLDQALFESVIASEIRALGTCGAFDRLFDLFSQFVCQVTSYRWLAVSTTHPRRMGLHCNPSISSAVEVEARTALQLPAEVRSILVEDEDAFEDPSGPTPIVCAIELGTNLIGHLALAVRDPTHFRDIALVTVLARELAGPIRMVSLVEESQQLSRVDPLTGLVNRRAFREHLELELARARRHNTPVACVLFDIDHFKNVNDQRGHATGDIVLTSMGELLRRVARQTDVNCRWGGEEFVVALHHCDLAGACTAAERLRQEVELCRILDAQGTLVPITASFGVAEFLLDDNIDTLIDRADRAMYEAKTSGRNRVMPPVKASTSLCQATGE
ncbi:MAG TPA: diguanylate cyclase [Polyangiaceae bacterium]